MLEIGVPGVKRVMHLEVCVSVMCIEVVAPFVWIEIVGSLMRIEVVDFVMHVIAGVLIGVHGVLRLVQPC